MVRKRKSRKKRKVEITYAINIAISEVSYSFAVSPENYFVPGPYWEHLSLKLSGTIVDPETFNGRALSINILGSRTEEQAFEKASESRVEPICVGTLTLRGQQSEFLGSVPFSVLPLLYTLIKDGETRFLILGGPPLFRGTSEIRTMHFENNYKPEDWGGQADDGPTQT